ncbi:DUF1796 family putative cysteine peptidase [Sphingobium sp. HDIP04]|uniref:DUF1796 family putative cysteine peptidase n=1 Tax=Sphingobium sp. HDIP04 TaxID=428994 RepID=UPI0003877DEB|nr:DUF1796 family putative cysteine peptidase [Sphingobium sp. HDIP04]EQB03927.1 hypothetical protein L286_11220 [Sphingobium sp. HDIP04]
MTLDDLDNIEGTGFTAGKVDAALYGPLVGFAADLSRNKFALGSAELAQIRKAKERAIALATAHFDNMERTVEARREHLTRYAHIKFVSLGFDCFPRTLLTRWGFKPPAKLGEASHPFDLAVHPANAVAHVLASDFAPYFDGSLRFDAALNHPVHDGLAIDLNHEIGEQFAANDFADLKARYERRAENFRSLARSPAPAVFLHHTDTAASEDIGRLFGQVRAMRGDRPTALVCLYTPPFGEDAPRLQLADDVHVITQAYPFAKYIWHNPRHTFSLRGVAFETAIADKLKAHIAVKAWGDARLREPA